MAGARVDERKGEMVRTEVRVAVVDDDASLCKSLGRLLRSCGFDVHLFESAEDFLASCDAALPGCLILDIQLGGMSGLDLLEELRMRRLSLPTVVITARESVDHPRLGFDWRSKSGVIPCLAKPFGAELLLDAIEHVLDSPK